MEQVSFRVMAAEMATLLQTVYCSLEAWLEISPWHQTTSTSTLLGAGEIYQSYETVLEQRVEVCRTLYCQLSG